MGHSRDRNEDALLQRPPRRLVAVADGMGGHAGGDIASRIAVDVIDDHSAHLPDTGVDAYFHDAVHAAHHAILRAAGAEPGLEGMGTTLTVLYVGPDTRTGTLAHVGDSRAYRWRAGTLTQLTRDQTWVQQQIDDGRLSPERARSHPFSAMLTCALGIRDVDLDVQIIDPDPQPGDLFLLCSDGLTAELSDQEILRLLDHHDDLDTTAARLIAAANDSGGSDNITVALVRILQPDN